MHSESAGYLDCLFVKMVEAAPAGIVVVAVGKTPLSLKGLIVVLMVEVVLSHVLFTGSGHYCKPTDIISIKLLKKSGNFSLNSFSDRRFPSR